MQLRVWLIVVPAIILDATSPAVSCNPPSVSPAGVSYLIEVRPHWHIQHPELVVDTDSLVASTLVALGTVPCQLERCCTVSSNWKDCCFLFLTYAASRGAP